MTGGYLAGRTAYLLRRLGRRIWFRASLFSLAAVLTALVAAWIAPLVPAELSLRVGGRAVDNILTIVASSMLAVTTFALSAAVTAYGAATSTVTPRATQLLIEDRFTQNALSTFVGTFLFAIVGIVALTTGFYGPQGRVVLFFATILVVAIIAITLLRWIQHLAAFGRVTDSIARVEAVAREAMRGWAAAPHLGGLPPVPVPAAARPIRAAQTGYLTHIDMAGLARRAARHDCTIHVAELPGAFVHPDRILAYVTGPAAADESIAEAFAVMPDRDFDQDPRFGLIVLSEIASRALSPAVNDPGTAIRVLGSGHRVLLDLIDTPVGRHAGCHRRIHAPHLDTEDLFVDLFRPIARDGAAMIEVQLRLQATLVALAAHAPQRFGAVAARHSHAALDRATEAMTSADDITLLRAAAIGAVSTAMT